MGQINLLKTDDPQTPSAGRVGIYIDSTNAPILILEDGSEIPLGGTTLEQIYIDAITGGQNPSSENPFVTLEQLNNAVSGGINSVLEGGQVQWSGAGLVFNTSFARYIIQGTIYEATSGTLTLTAADATNDRRDRFKLTTSGWAFDTGTPAATPIAPQINVITEIDRGDVLIEALATTPTVTDEDVYLENTEWTTSSGGSGTFNADSTNDPFAGSKSFEVTNIQSGGFMQFTNGSDFDFVNLETLGFQLKLKATMNNGRFIRAQFLDNSDTLVGSSNAIAIDKGNSSTYQFVAVGIDQIVTAASAFRKIRLIYQGTGGAATYSGYFVDNVIIETGITGGVNPTFTQDEIDAIKNATSPSGSNTFVTQSELAAAVYPEMQVRENNQLLFDNDYSTGIESTARSGNITVDFTGAKRGACTVMRHNDGSAFTYPTENLIISGEYVPSVDNYLFFLLVNKTVSSEVILCTISQEIP